MIERLAILVASRFACVRSFGDISRVMTDNMTVLFQSDTTLVVDKGFDIKINSNTESDHTVATILARQFPDLIDNTVVFGFRFVHRLDYATSGVLCLALNRKTASVFEKLFRKRKIMKHYLALVYGHVKHDHLLVDVPIGRDSSETDISKMCVASSPHCKLPAKECATVVVRLETGTYGTQPATKLLLIPQTGRQHQLRVHCCHIGHRIIGDYMYSNRTDSETPRMMLHAYNMHVPMSPEPMYLKAQDYFLPEHDSSWKPTKTYTTYEQFCQDFYVTENNCLQLKIDDLKPKMCTLDGIK